MISSDLSKTWVHIQIQFYLFNVSVDLFIDLWGWEGSAQAGASEEDTEAGRDERRDGGYGEAAGKAECWEEPSPGGNGPAAESTAQPGSQWPQTCQ